MAKNQIDMAPVLAALDEGKFSHASGEVISREDVRTDPELLLYVISLWEKMGAPEGEKGKAPRKDPEGQTALYFVQKGDEMTVGEMFNTFEERKKRSEYVENLQKPIALASALGSEAPYIVHEVIVGNPDKDGKVSLTFEKDTADLLVGHLAEILSAVTRS